MSSLKNFEHELRQIAEAEEEEKTDEPTLCPEDVVMEEPSKMPGEFIYTCSIKFKKAGRKHC